MGTEALSARRDGDVPAVLAAMGGRPGGHAIGIGKGGDKDGISQGSNSASNSIFRQAAGKPGGAQRAYAHATVMQEKRSAGAMHISFHIAHPLFELIVTVYPVRAQGGDGPCWQGIQAVASVESPDMPFG